MPEGGPNSERVLILAPGGRDARVAAQLLQEAGWPASICADVGELCSEFEKGSAFAVVAEEAVASFDLAPLVSCIRAQPAWSDFPIILMTGRGDTPERNAFAQRFQEILGNVAFLERPFHPTTLVSLAHSAVRSRRRQYQARELLERYKLLARELQHRTKNLLAVIQSIGSASLTDGPERDSFFSRLHALAKAQDLLMEGDGRGALLNDVVTQAMESFGARVSIEGPPVFLKPTLAQGFALIMHELATNATKHGALSTPAGKVSVSWKLEPGKKEQVICFRWQERNGPPTKPPARKGFGTVLLEHAIANSGGPPRFDYAPEGFTYELHTPHTASAADRAIEG